MVKKSLLIALFLLGFYSFLIHFTEPWEDVAQTQWHRNSIQAEKYLFSPQKDHIIVGSSLSSRLVKDSLPESVHNLAFGGQSIYDGLQIIQESSLKPKSVLIEINTIFTRPKPEFIEELFSPLTYRLKSYLPIFRSEYMPFANLIPLVIKLKYTIFPPEVTHNTIKVGFPPNSPLKKNAKSKDPIYNNLLIKKQNSYKVVPDQEEINMFLSLLASYIQELESQGVDVTFFEIPIHPTLCNSTRVQTIREVMYSQFPRNEYTYVLAPDCKDFQTTDGTHLSPESALKYTLFFKKNVLSRYP